MRRCLPLLILMTGSVWAAEPATNDWPAFLGPGGFGISSETGLMKTWPAEGPPVVWEKSVGTGYSAPSIRGSKLVIHHRRRNEDVVECLDALSGKVQWTHTYETNFRDPFGYNNGPRASPVLTEKYCYTFGAQGKLFCLEMETGAVVWQRDTAQDWNVPDHFFGAGCSPILEGNLLIVMVGGQPNSGVVAFNAENGQTVWEAVGQKTWDKISTSDWPQSKYRWTGEEMIVSYASPIATTIHGHRHLLCLTRHGLVSLDPKDGRERFAYWFRSRKHESVNAARPVVVNDLVFLSAAYETGAALLRIGQDGKSFQEVWRDRRGMSSHWSTPIVYRDHVYGFSGRHEEEAEFQCVELSTGKLRWETNGFDGKLTDLELIEGTSQIRDKRTGKPIPFPFFGRASKILVEDMLIVLAERGSLSLVKPSSDKFQLISRCSVKGINAPSWTAPVLVRGRLYLRDEDQLICLDLREPSAKTLDK